MANFSLEVLHPRNYDENLGDNPFYQMFRGSRKEIYESAIRKGWLICIPRVDSLTKTVYQDADFLSHVLVEYTNTHGDKQWKTLQNQEVTFGHRKIITGKGFRHAKQVDVLFQETCYSEVNETSYQLLCLSEPLNTAPDISMTHTGLTVDVLDDCKEFLWEITGNTKLKKRVDQLIEDMTMKLKKLRNTTDVHVYRQKISQLHAEAFDILAQDSNVVRVLKQDAGFEQLIKLALETYMMNSMYTCLFYCLTNCYSGPDTALNQIIRRWHQLPARKAGFKADFCESLPKARKELNVFPKCSTPLAKAACLKRVFTYLTTIRKVAPPSSNSFNNSLTAVDPDPEREAITSDDLLSAVVFMILKSDIPNWFTHVNYTGLFRFVKAPTDDEYSFYLTTIEAALEHVLTLANKNPLEDSLVPSEESRPNAPSAIVYEENEADEFNDDSEENKQLAALFQKIKVGDCNGVIEMLRCSHRVVYEGSGRLGSAEQQQQQSPTRKDPRSGQCHPLCQCEVCHSKTSTNTASGIQQKRATLQNHYATMPPSRTRWKSMLGETSVTWTDGGALNVMSSPSKSSSNVVTVHSANEQGLTALHMAALYGHSELTTTLLEQFNAVTEQYDVEGRTALHLACAAGHHDVALVLLHAGANVNAADCEGCTPLHYATEKAFDQCVTALLFFGGPKSVLDVDAADIRGNTALHIASRWGYASIVKVLLDSRANSLLENALHQTPTQVACYESLSQILAKAAAAAHSAGCPQSATSLADHSFTNSQDNSSKPRTNSLTGSNPHLHARRSLVPSATHEGVDQFLVVELEPPGLNGSPSNSNISASNLSSQPTSRRHSRQLAAGKESTKSVVNVAEFNEKVKRILQATTDGDLVKVHQLLRIFPPPTEMSLRELVLQPKVDILRAACDPLCQCEMCSVVERVKTTSILMSGMSPHVNSANSNGFTAMHVAAIHNHGKLSAQLLYEGADPRLRTHHVGMSALHCAAYYNSVDVLTLLLIWAYREMSMRHNDCALVVGAVGVGVGANVSEDEDEDYQSRVPLWRCLDEKANTPLHYAAIKGHKVCVDMLLNAAAQWNGEEELQLLLHARNSRGNTALHEAARPGHEECVSLLLARGADPRLKNNQHFTASHLTLSMKCASLLKKAEEERALRQPRCISENPELPLVEEGNFGQSQLRLPTSSSSADLSRIASMSTMAFNQSASREEEEIGQEAMEDESLTGDQTRPQSTWYRQLSHSTSDRPPIFH